MQLVTPGESLTEGTSVLDRVFVVVDYSRGCRRALATALEIQRTHGSAVCLFHSGESDASDDWLGGIGATAVRGEPEWEAEDRLRRYVENVCPECRDQLELRARVGDPLETIPLEARDWGATLVIAAASNRREFFTSPAEQLVHKLRIPTLILPM